MEKVLTITKAEAQADWRATRRDIERLEAIVENLSGFINDSHGETRFLPYKAHLFLYESLLRQAYSICQNIETAIPYLE